MAKLFISVVVALFLLSAAIAADYRQVLFNSFAYRLINKEYIRKFITARFMNLIYNL